LVCLLFLSIPLHAQQPTTPHGHPPQPSTSAPPAGEVAPPQVRHQEHRQTGLHPPYYDYPFGSTAVSHRSITVDQAIQLALKNASLYRQAEIDERIASEDVRQARAAFLPQLSIPLTYNGTTTSRFRLPDEPPTFSFVSSSAINETSAFLTATGSIDLSGRLRAALRRTRAQLMAARAGTQAARRALVISTVDAYYGLSLARQKRRLADETLALAEAFARIAESKRGEENGEADLLRARSAALLRRDELEQARAAEAASMDLLRTLTGVDFSTHIALPLLTNDLPTTSDFSGYTEELLKARPELSQIEALQRAAKAEASEARRELLPDMTYSINGGFDAGDFRPLGRYSGAQAIVTLNIPVFNWGASRSRETQAKLRAQSLDLQRESTLQQLRQEFYTARATAFSAIERARLTQEAANVAQQNVTQTFASYRLKKGTILDVIDAQANYAAARLAYYQSIADYRTSRIRLELDPARMGKTGAGSPHSPGMTSQYKCLLNLQQAPEINGLRLGMSLDRAQSLYPAFKVQPADESGVLKATFNIRELAAQPGAGSFLAGAERVALEFMDGQLSFMRIYYPVTNQWESTDEFVSVLSEKLNIKGDWKYFYDWEHKEIHDTKELRDLALECNGFRISAGIGVEGIGRDQTPHLTVEKIKN
jgi:outer membrane protein TolC